MTIGTAGDFTISFARDEYEPQTVTVHSTISEGNYMTAPSPVLYRFHSALNRRLAVSRHRVSG
jgi:hypothetical protein